ncbi:gluconokinase [Salana multivorans]
MVQQWGVEPSDAVSPLVLALDVGSTASRGALFDAHGRPVGKRAKILHSFTSGPDGTSEIDADQVVTELSSIIDKLLRRSGPSRGHVIGGVALDTFASSMVIVDDEGRALTPCATYADSRPHAFVDVLRGEIAEADLHQRVGTRIHTSYWPARLRWLQAERPELVEQAAHYLSLGDYVLWKLTGTLATGTSSAAWTGMVDLRTADWSEEVLELSGIDRSKVAPIHHLDQPLSISVAGETAIAKRWPALTKAKWFAPIPDGLAANVGLGAADETTIGGTAATSGALRVLVRDLPERLPGGLWCYRVSHDRALVGGALNDVGRAIHWATSALALGSPVGGVRGALTGHGPGAAAAALTAALSAAPSSTTPLVLPFFTGERSTGWAANARAVFTGIDASSTGAAMARGVVEGIAISYGRILAQLRELAPGASALHIGGSVTTEHPVALQIVADTLELPLTPVTIKRSTLLGNALLALETVAPGVERIGPVHGGTLEPSEESAGYYRERVGRFEDVYQAQFG